jgi:hypothetical protein
MKLLHASVKHEKRSLIALPKRFQSQHGAFVQFEEQKEATAIRRKLPQKKTENK